MDFFGIGAGEILVILVIALLVFGPDKLPEIGRTLGDATRKMKDAASDFAGEMNKEMEDARGVKNEISGLVKNEMRPLAEMKEEVSGVVQKEVLPRDAGTRSDSGIMVKEDDRDTPEIGFF